MQHARLTIMSSVKREYAIQAFRYSSTGKSKGSSSTLAFVVNNFSYPPCHQYSVHLR